MSNTIANKNKINLVAKLIKFIEGMGNNSAISISNTRNRTARIKNRIEKGIRAELCGSKPHSNGVLFSNLSSDFLFRIRVRIIITNGKIVAITIIKVIFIIFLGVYLYL